MNTLNPTTRALMDVMHDSTMRELQKSFPCIDQFDHRMLTYLLIETRRAAYKENGSPIELISVLRQFNVQKYDTYYEWRLKWYKFLPSNVKNFV